MPDLTINEVAARLKVTREYIRNLISKGRLRKGKLIDGRTYLITEESVREYEEQRQPSGRPVNKWWSRLSKGEREKLYELREQEIKRRRNKG